MQRYRSLDLGANYFKFTGFNASKIFPAECYGTVSYVDLA
jgi:hypothetical protein